MKEVIVTLPNKKYTIYIAADLFSQQEFFANFFSGQQYLIVTNQTVGFLYLEKIKNLLKDKVCDSILLRDGEEHKNLTTLNSIFDLLLQNKHTRKTTLIALGGGVIGDITGFAAACYMRGVPFIQMPTTLLAQVDAAIGGKTAVNHELGKNMIGVFYQPQAVFIDISILASLPDRVFKEGLAEVIKYGLIYDFAFFAWIENNLTKILQKDLITLEELVFRCCEIKAGFIMRDETEQGERALLNFGHTFGHAIETGMGYGKWLHGEAVAVGMLLATKTSQELGWLHKQEVERIQNILLKIGLPTFVPKELSAEKMLELMRRDKKNINQNLRLILLKKLGEAVIVDDVSDNVVLSVLNFSKKILELKGKINWQGDLSNSRHGRNS